jgi:hypothetical protein
MEGIPTKRYPIKPAYFNSMGAYKHLLISLCLLASLPAFAQKKDTILLFNGQILIGEVQNASLGEITIDDIDLKMQEVKLYKIKLLKTQHEFKIETVDKKLYYGALKTSQRPGWVDIVWDSVTITSMAIVNINDLISLDRNIFKRLNGNVSAGLSFTKSSEIGQVNLSSTVYYATKLFQYQLMVSELGSIDSSKFSRDNEIAQLFVGFDLTTTWFVAGVGQYQRNLELSIARRYLEILGGGNKLVIKKNWQLLGMTGIGFTQEKSTEGIASGLQLEIPLMFRFNFYQFHHPNIRISSSQTAYFSLTEKDRFRYDGSTNFNWELIRYFNLTVSPYTNYDSKPPSNNGTKFDFGIVLGLTYTF